MVERFERWTSLHILLESSYVVTYTVFQKLLFWVFTLQDETFKIPDGYKEDQDARILAQTTGDGKNAKISSCHLENGDKAITIKVIFSEAGITNVTGPQGSKDATIGGQAGFLTQEKDGVLFDYNKDDKLIEISAPTQEDLEALFK